MGNYKRKPGPKPKRRKPRGPQKELKPTERHLLIAKNTSEKLLHADDLTEASRIIKREMARQGYSLGSIRNKTLGEIFKSIPSLGLAIQSTLQDKAWAELEKVVDEQPPDQRQIETLRNLVRYRLMTATLHGDWDPRLKKKVSGAVAAARELGKLKEVGLFDPDVQVGIAALMVPNDPEWKKRYSLGAPSAEEAGASDVADEGSA